MWKGVTPNASAPAPKGNRPLPASGARSMNPRASLLDNATFESLAREWAEHQRRFVPNWEI